MKPSPEIDPVDAHVGKRLRFARALRGLSQERLAALENLTFQQQQKYEKGLTRVSASRLYHLAEHLRLPVVWFFEGLPDPSGGGVTHPDISGEYMPDDKDAYQLFYQFRAIEDRAKRKALLRILQSIIKFIAPTTATPSIEEEKPFV